MNRRTFLTTLGIVTVVFLALRSESSAREGSGGTANARGLLAAGVRNGSFVRMATAHVGSLGPFDPKVEQIDSYISRLEIWLTANSVKNELKVVSTLAVIGPEAFDVVRSSLYPTDPKTKSFDDIKTILVSHFHTPRNTVLERITFRARTQQEAENVSSFALALKRLSMSCGFGETLEDNLLERFISGLKDVSIRKKLLTAKELTWANAQAEAIAMEQTSGENAVQIRNGGTGSSSNVNKVRQSVSTQKSRPKSYQQRHSRPNPSSDEACERCLGSHPSTECPFKRAVCFACNRKGHVKAACRNRSRSSQTSTSGGDRGKSARGKSGGRGRGRHVNQVDQYREEEPADQDVMYGNLYRIDAVKSEKHEFVVTVTVEGQPVKFAVDTQASVSVVSEELYERYFKHCDLMSPRGALKSYSDHVIPVVGEITVTVEYEGQVQRLPLVVVSGSKESLLGREWLKAIRINWPALFRTFSVRNSATVQDVVQKYSSVFNKRSEHNTIKDFTVDLKLKVGSKPVFMKARPVPYALRAAVEKNLEKAVTQGILHPVRTSKWASPVVVAPKADKSIRLCGDYKRTVNAHLDDEVYPLPTSQDIFSTLAGGTVFTKLDLSNAYQQIALSDEAKELLTINTHKGLYQYQRLPYGVKVAPAIFQSIMDQILAGLDGVCCYIDDILVTSKTMEQHVHVLEMVFMRLEEYGVLVNRDKCDFAIDQVTYLGHVIDRQGIRPSPEKVSAITAVKGPTNVAELKTFLGAVTFYHKFLYNFASICAPLYNLTKQGTPWKWTDECESAVQKVKDMLVSGVVLTHYDVQKPLTLATDASPYGVAAVLSHVDEQGAERPVAYASRTLAPAEKNYSQLEREALAIMFGIKRFHKYIYGRQFVLITDNKPLTSIFSPSKDIPTVSALRLQRWALVLMAHDYKIQYRCSQEHGNVDMLSRFPEENTTAEQVELQINHFSYVNDLPVTSDEVRKETASDHVLAQVVRYVMFGWPNQVEGDLVPFHRRRNELSIDQGCLLWGLRVVIPHSLRNRVLEDVHRDHIGVVRMKMLARSYWWFPDMDKALENIARSCDTCALHGSMPKAAPTVHWPLCDRPWERVHIDFGTLQGKDFLVLFDVYSKWMEVAVMTTTTAAQTIQVLRGWFARFGVPREVVSDNGPQFTSDEFETFLRNNGIKHTLTPPYSPQTNGSAERAVQTVKGCLKKKLADEVAGVIPMMSFQRKVDDFLITYRSTPTSTTGVSPAEKFLGRTIRTRLSLLRPEGKALPKPTSNSVRTFEDGDPVWVRNFVGRQKWLPGEVIRRQGLLKYDVQIGTRSRLVHVDHLTRRSPSGSTMDSNLCPNDTIVPQQSSVDGMIATYPNVNVPHIPLLPKTPVVGKPDVSVTPNVSQSPSVPQTPVVTPSHTQVNNTPVRRHEPRERRKPKRLIEQM